VFSVEFSEVKHDLANTLALVRNVLEEPGLCGLNVLRNCLNLSGPGVECLFVDLVEMSDLFLIGDISLLVSLQIVRGLV